MSRAIERFYAILEMSRLSIPKPYTERGKLGEPEKTVTRHESIWSDSELKQIKKEMIECIREIKEEPNDN